MFEVRVEIDFPAGHHLIGYQGDCARPHGHNWKVEVFVRTQDLDPVGMAIDFRVLKAKVKEVIGAWDHQDLNLLDEFTRLNPTAENMAKTAFEKLAPEIAQIRGPGTWLEKVVVWENDRCWASYFLTPKFPSPSPSP